MERSANRVTASHIAGNVLVTMHVTRTDVSLRVIKEAFTVGKQL